MRSVASIKGGRAKACPSTPTDEDASLFFFGQAVNFDGKGATVGDMAAYLGLAERTIRNRVQKMNGEFVLEKGRIRAGCLRPDLDPNE